MEKIILKIKELEKPEFSFVPSKKFYAAVGINQKRWAKLWRGELDLKVSELKNLAKYFNIPITELI